MARPTMPALARATRACQIVDHRSVGRAPALLIGSANFSDESVNLNDEYTLLIDGDRWAIAIAATEFLRVFGHYQFRNQ